LGKEVLPDVQSSVYTTLDHVLAFRDHSTQFQKLTMIHISINQSINLYLYGKARKKNIKKQQEERTTRTITTQTL